MTHASICTVGDEILIGQIVDTNSSRIARALGEIGIQVGRMVSIGDRHEAIVHNIRQEMEAHEIVITTGGLGPTKDDITKTAIAEISGSDGYTLHEGQLAIVRRILASRGLDMLENNRAQALVPNRCEVIPNPLGTAPVLVYRGPRATLYCLPGVPHEAAGVLPEVLADIRRHQRLESITHRHVMVYGWAESALSEKIAPWEDALPAGMKLAYLPNPLTGIRLRLSAYGGEEDLPARMEAEISRLKELLGDAVYAEADTQLEAVVGALLKENGLTLSTAESCTGGMIAHLITTVPGASAYFLGSVVSYAVSVKEGLLGVPHETIKRCGVVSSEVAAAMAEGVRRATGSDFAVATTGLAGKEGDGTNPGGTVWIGVSGPEGTKTFRHHFQNDRQRNIERFAATALNQLRLVILSHTRRKFSPPMRRISASE